MSADSGDDHTERIYRPLPGRVRVQVAEHRRSAVVIVDRTKFDHRGEEDEAVARTRAHAARVWRRE